MPLKCRPPRTNQRLAEDPRPDRQLIIPIFMPHQGCPHRCVFCNQRAITQGEAQLPSQDQLRRMVASYLNYSGKRRSRVQISFFGGNFLGLAPDAILSMLSAAEWFVKSGLVDGIRFSTRPDSIDTERLELIEPYSIQTVELGAQSMQDDVLQRAGRGHLAQDTISAVDLLGQCAYEIGLQLMIGLPGETEPGCFASAKKAAGLHPDFIRLYPVVVLAGSRMAEWYKAGEYTPLSLSECLERVKQLYLFFSRHGIRITRMGLQAGQTSDDADPILAGPHHPAFGHLVHSGLFLDMARLLLNSSGGEHAAVSFGVHPRSVSRMRGLRSDNVMLLRKEYAIGDLQVQSDPQLPMDGLKLDATGAMLTYADLQCDI